MKKSFIILSLISLITLPAFAELTVEDSISRDYLKNHGYSDATINITHKSRAQANGEPLAAHEEKDYYNQPVVKYVRRFFMYLDPSLDEHKFMNDHNINTTSRYDDL